MRAGVKSRINGAVVALMMLSLAAAPFSVIEYLPSYFFGSLMIWIGWEIAWVSTPTLYSCVHVHFKADVILQLDDRMQKSHVTVMTGCRCHAAC